MDGRLFTLGIGGIVSAFNAADGKVLWQKPGPTVDPLYGTAMSPVFDRGNVIFHVGGQDNGALTAFDATTGNVKWAWPGDGTEKDIYIKWRVEGLEGMAQGTIGWPDYPARTPSTLEFTTKRSPGQWHRPAWDRVWFPDAFQGTMAQLLRAVEAEFPEFAAQVRKDDGLAPGLAASIDGAFASRGLSAKIGPTSEVHLIPAVGGG